MQTHKQFLMVYPEIPDTYWSFHHALGIIGKRAVMPPLGLATVAALLPSEYECRIVDMNIEPLDDDSILAADLVLISAMIVQADSTKRLVERSRRLGVPVAVGGPYPTACCDELAGVDHLILGEGEVTFPRFLQDYEAGRAQRVYSDVAVADIETSPIPRFDLLKLDQYHMVPIQFSRGCPFDCEFCDIVQLFGHTVRSKTPERFVAEMDAAYRTGFRGAMFVVDDNFIGNHRRTKELLRAMVAWQRRHNYPFSLSTEASIDLAYDPELLELMVQAGFGMAFVGLESPIDDSLAAAGKQQNRKQDALTSVRTIQRSGIEVTGGFIIGFDNDPPEIFDRQIEFIQELAIPTAMIGLLTALPKTKLYERLEREGRLYGNSNGNNVSSTAMNFRPVLPEQLIADGYRKVLKSIYSPERYFERCLKLLELMPRSRGTNRVDETAATPDGTAPAGAAPAGAKPPRGRVTKQGLMTAARSLVRQTFSRYGPRYLSFIVRALLRRPDQIVMVFTLAIQGHHYMQVTRNTLRESPAAVMAPADDRRVEPAARTAAQRYHQAPIAGTME